MKKAVTIVKSFLKFSQLKKKSEVQKADSDKECRKKPKLPEVKIFRPCERCVLVYENSIWNSFERKLLQQEYYEFASEDSDEQDYKTPTDRALEYGQIQAFFRHHGLIQANQKELSVCSDKSCMNSSCLRSHVIWDGKSTNLDGQSHYPTFVFMAKSKATLQRPLLYEDSDVILLRMNFSTLHSILNWSLAHETSVKMNVEVWVLITKLRHETVTLRVEEDLVYEYLDYIILMVFLGLSSSRETRANHVENLFQAVDNILDISLYITLTSGIPPEDQSYIKDTIIETATVMTSTAAESTATVGIETAAMAMGQAAAGVALSVLVDVAITAGIVTRAKIRRDKGIISQKEFQKTVRHKLCDSGCQFIGGTTGTIVGQVLIPVPVVGAIVGGFCGSLIGAGVSKGIIKTSEIISKAQASKLKAITDK